MLQLISKLPSRWQSALKGALLGDALGVPHEFKPGYRIPDYEHLQMAMPAGYPKSYETVPYGCWSDDGSQMVALLELLLRQNGSYTSEGFLANLLAWRNDAKFQAGGVVFDIGAQTRVALDGPVGRLTGRLSSLHCGNGSLMRVLPVAMMPDVFGTPRAEAIQVAMAQSSVTHPQALARTACAIYVELCWLIQDGAGSRVADLVTAAARNLLERQLLTADEVAGLSAVISFGRTEMPTGSGHVVNTLWTALHAVQRAASLSETLRLAVGYGNDTDTVACIAGGLAGLAFGIDPLSEAWWGQMVLPRIDP